MPTLTSPLVGCMVITFATSSLCFLIYNKYTQFVENCFELCHRQALHAKTLGFIHPVSGERMFFECDMPTDMEAVIDKWRGYYKVKGVLD